MHLCFYSDETASNFLPLTLTRPMDDLRIGVFTIREKWIKTLKPSGWIRQTKEYLNPLFECSEVDESDDYFWINSRILPSKDVVEAILKLKAGEQLFWDDQILCSRLSGVKTNEHLKKDTTPGMKNPQKEFNSDPIVLKYLWDLLELNSSQISSDLKLLPSFFRNEKRSTSGIVFSNPENILIHDTAKIEPGCILLADKGPIYIGPEAIIEAGAILKGPVAICDKSVVKMGTKLSGGSTIGPVSKVGGEVNNCIFHSYSNKAHHGFAGNSVFGQWCNLAAGTVTSNLKNSYSKIKIPHWESGELSNDGVQFFGTVFGDFSRTAINTSLNSGTICGVSSNIFSRGFSPKIISSFSWIGDDGVSVYEFEKALITMKAMMNRRGVELTQDYISMMRYLYQLENTSGS